MRRRRLRPFRLGLWLGAVAGAAWFVQRYQRSRQEIDAVEAGGWSVVESTAEPQAAATAAAPPAAIPDVPVVPIVEAEVRAVGDVVEAPGEPEIEPVAEAAPVAEAPVEPVVEPAPEPVFAAEPTEPAAPVLDVAPPPPELQPEPELAAAPVKKAARKKAAAKKAAAKKAAPAPPPEPWVTPEPDGTCPTSHPIKGKLSSKLFHLPGMFAYARTKADRCYLDATAAEADGLNKAKR